MPADIKLEFDQGEYIALQNLALKHHVSLGVILRIGARLLLEADHRGFVKVGKLDSPLVVMPKGARLDQ